MIVKTEQIEIQQRPIAGVLKELAEATPRLVGPFTPSNGAEQKRAFLAGEIAEPRHHYPKLEAYDSAESHRTLDALREQIAVHPDVSGKYKDAYEDAIGENLAKLRMLEIARALHDDLSEEEHDDLAAEFMKLNIEVHGAPDREVYDSLVHDTATISEKATEGTAAKVAQELLDLLPDVNGSHERFTPQPETAEWIKTVAETLYQPLVDHVDVTKEAYSPSDVRDLFEEIIRTEFGEAAKHWSVIISDTQASIEVQRLDKQVIIPASRKSSTPEEMKGLVAHELGVHMLRTLMGEETDMALMSTGFARYADIEEGLGMVMQQVIKGEFKDAGVGLYLAASLAYFEKKTFRETFEIMWRRTALEKLKPGEALDAAAVEAAQSTAYGVTQRIFRGTDELPWFKDLSYLSGTDTILKHLESIRGDDLQLTFLLLGKADPTSTQHVRTMLETSSN